MELEAASILERLEKEGFEAFFVGGYVRDKVLGKPVKDIDIATSAKPEDVIRLFEKTVPTGLKHGTVTVLVNKNAYEVTTFRKESDYEGFRRPTEVEFISDLHEDLRRRDFTMNAMAMNRRGDLIDPFGGREDIRSGLLRCVGDPHERFHEDALRMLRCVRFASIYGLEVEPDTWEALLQRRVLLKHVSMERVRAEMERILAGPQPFRGLKLLVASGLLSQTKAELKQLPVTRWGEDELPAELAATDRLTDARSRWMLLFESMDVEADVTESALRALTFSVKDTTVISRYVSVHQWLKRKLAGVSGHDACRLWKESAVLYGKDLLLTWLAVHHAFAETGLNLPAWTAEVLAHGEAWLAEMPLILMKELAVSGKQLMDEIGQPAGPWVGTVMQSLLIEAALGQIRNKQGELLKRAKQIKAGVDLNE